MRVAIAPNEQLAAQTKLALRRLASAVAVVSCRRRANASCHDGNRGQRHEHAATFDRLRQSCDDVL